METIILLPLLYPLALIAFIVAITIHSRITLRKHRDKEQ